MVKIVAIIPARWGSSRFTGKPLAPILGRPMIQHVYERSTMIPLVQETFVATDDLRIADAVRGFGGQVILTREDHPSGSDRLNEAAEFLGLADSDIILNVQGDQPAFDPLLPDKVIQPLLADPALEMSTLAIPLNDEEAVSNPNHGKVVFGENQLALYFSRAPIPYPRDGEVVRYYRHIGLYGYRKSFLNQFTQFKPGILENIEKLEQLRALENKARIYVALAEGLSPEVDVPEDIPKAEAALKAMAGN